MPPKQRLTHMFPHRIVLITSLVLCVCATCSILLSFLSLTNKLWGYYFKTGIWSGAVILITGILGIVCNYVRTVPAVKSFMITAIFGVLVSLALIALSAGGLDVKSGFYSGRRNNAFLNNICHGVSLGIGVLQLTLCILCDGICIYYLFMDNSQLYKVEDASNNKKKKSHKHNKKSNSRASTRSDAPLIGSSSKQKSPRNSKKKQRSTSYDEDQDYQVEYRKPSRRLNGQSSSPNSSPCVRPSSFSTFGRSDVGDRASLIVHPGDTASIADTTRSQTPSVITTDECHYAQTMLFDRPLPIEEDEELPPYQAVDPYSQVPISAHVSPVSNSSLRRTNSAPLQNKKRSSNERQKIATTRSSIPRGRSQRDCKTLDTSLIKGSPQKPSTSKDSPIMRHSQSADLLNTEGVDLDEQVLLNQQGVSYRDFAYSSDRFHTDDIIVKRRTNSLRADRTKRLDRRRRALSAEIKVSREHILCQSQGLGPRTSSIDGSNIGLFASNRIIPTKFSLRTPVRQVGMPHVRSAIPVKSVTSLPIFSPPPKPPRTFSVKADDLNVNLDADTEPKVSVDDVFEATTNRDSASKPLEAISVPDIGLNLNDPNETNSNALNGTMKIDAGPVIKCKVPQSSNLSVENEENGANDNCGNNTKKDNDTLDSSNGAVELPMSPTIKCPITSVQKTNESTVIYAKVNKNRNKQGMTTNQKTQKITDKMIKHDSGATEQELSVEDKVSMSLRPMSGDKGTEPEKLSNEIEKHQNLQVRLPALSPSERILKKTAPMSGSPVLPQPDVSRGPNDKVVHNGARPKTVIQRKNKDIESQAMPVPKPRNIPQNVNDNGNGLSKTSLKNRYSIPQDKTVRNQTGSPSQPTTPSSRNSAPASSNKTQNVGPLTRHSISSVRSSPGSLMTARSQGVLLLPQSQHNRHLQGERRGTGNSPPVNQAAGANQNPQNRDVENTNASLYAKIL